eukprot:gene33781-41672_t
MAPKKPAKKAEKPKEDEGKLAEMRSQQQAAAKHEKKDLAAVIEAVEQQEETADSSAKHDFEQLREENRNKNLEEINMLRISLDAQIEELEQHFETAHLNYLSQTSHRTHDFKEKTQKDQILTLDIEQKRKKIDNLQTQIQQWRAKMKQLNRETEERNRLLLDEKHSIQKHYQQLKQRIKLYRRIMELTELNRHMETVEEQTLPFGGSDEGGIIGENHLLSSQSLVTSHAPLKHQSSVWADDNRTHVLPSDRLTNFNRKFNRILLDNLAIQKEKERLSLENAQLQDLIAQYISGTQIGDDTLSSDNPLFVINGRANLNFNPPVCKVRPVIQDADIIHNAL